MQLALFGEKGEKKKREKGEKIGKEEKKKQGSEGKGQKGKTGKRRKGRKGRRGEKGTEEKMNMGKREKEKRAQREKAEVAGTPLAGRARAAGPRLISIAEAGRGRAPARPPWPGQAVDGRISHPVDCRLDRALHYQLARAPGNIPCGAGTTAATNAALPLEGGVQLP